MQLFLPILIWASSTLPSCALGLLIPAYFDPGNHGADWEQMSLAASRIPVVAIMNPANGPSSAARTSYVNAIRNLQRNGGKVIGYVYSSYTKRALTEVQADIDRYYAFYNIDGIFIDEVTNDVIASHLNYYEELYRYIKDHHPAAWVVGNPGTATASAYLERPAADALVTFESNAGYGSYRPDLWTQSKPATGFAHLCYAISGASIMSNSVQLARSRNTAYVYVTDDSGSNPWDRLPAYWQEEVSLIEQLNRESAAALPARLSISLTGPEAARVLISGAPGRYVLQGSTDLQTWRSILTNISAEGRFAVPIPPSDRREHYRSEQ